MKKFFNRKIILTLCAAAMIGNSPLLVHANSDVQGHWAQQQIDKMTNQGLISGYENGEFKPNKPMTRAEFVVALNKILGFTNMADISFKDVSEKDWFAKQLAIALYHGYIKGYEDGTFRPDQPVSRLEAAVMIARANGLTKKVKTSNTDLQALKDEKSIPAWAREEVSAIVKSGIMKGDLNQIFHGEMQITRAEAVVSLSRAKDSKEEFEKIEKSQEAKQEIKQEANQATKKEIKKEVKQDKKTEAAKPKQEDKKKKSEQKQDNKVNVGKPSKPAGSSSPSAPAGGGASGGGGTSSGSASSSGGSASTGGGSTNITPPSSAPKQPNVPAPSIPSVPTPPSVPVPPSVPSPSQPQEKDLTEKDSGKTVPPATQTPPTNQAPSSPEGSAPAGPDSSEKPKTQEDTDLPKKDAKENQAESEKQTEGGKENEGKKKESSESGAVNKDESSTTPDQQDSNSDQQGTTPGQQEPTPKVPETDSESKDSESQEKTPDPSGSQQDSSAPKKEDSDDSPSQPDASSPQTGAPDSNSSGSQSGGTQSSDSKPQAQKKTPEELVEEFKGKGYTNVRGFTMNGDPRVILWTEGITAPNMEETGGDFKKENRFAALEYLLNFQPKSGWYDVNKKDENSRVFCSAAVAANMLHWWYDQNDTNIKNFLALSNDNGRIGKDGFFQYAGEFINSFKSQEDSMFFNMFLIHFSGHTNGVWTDITIDSFINGFNPRPDGGVNTENNPTDFKKGGFFKDIFKNHKLTDRTYVKQYDTLSKRVKEWLLDDRTIAISYTTNSIDSQTGIRRVSSHILQIWGAEYDAKGNIKAIYISDSDDKDQKELGMKRLDVINNGTALITNSSNHTNAPEAYELYSLSLGTEQWEKYFETQTAAENSVQP